MDTDTFNTLAGIATFIGLGIGIYSIFAVAKKKKLKAVSKGKNSDAIIGNQNIVNRGNNNQTNIPK